MEVDHDNLSQPDEAAYRAVMEAHLDELQRESEARRAELRRLAAELPRATSRRALTKSMVASVVRSPDRTLVAKRAVLKVLRQPTELVHRIKAR